MPTPEEIARWEDEAAEAHHNALAAEWEADQEAQYQADLADAQAEADLADAQAEADAQW